MNTNAIIASLALIVFGHAIILIGAALWSLGRRSWRPLLVMGVVLALADLYTIGSAIFGWRMPGT